MFTVSHQCSAMSEEEPPRPKEDRPRLVAPGLREHLYEARVVLLFGEIKAELARDICAQLLALAERSTDPIRMIIHSPGGHVESGDTIHDVVRFIGAPVYMLGTGWVASAGALIFAAAERNRRYSLPNTRFLLHQPLGGVQGPASDVEIETAQILAMRRRLNQIFALATGQDLARIDKDTDRNHWMTAPEARDYGLVGHIIENADSFLIE